MYHLKQDKATKQRQAHFHSRTQRMYHTIVGEFLSARVMRLAKKQDRPISHIIRSALQAYLLRHGA